MQGQSFVVTSCSIASYVPTDQERLELLQVFFRIQILSDMLFVYFVTTYQRGGLPPLPFVYSSFNQLCAIFDQLIPLFPLMQLRPCNGSIRYKTDPGIFNIWMKGLSQIPRKALCRVTGVASYPRSSHSLRRRGFVADRNSHHRDARRERHIACIPALFAAPRPRHRLFLIWFTSSQVFRREAEAVGVSGSR